MNNRPVLSQKQTVSRSERWWLIGAVLFGAILRLSVPGRMAVEHFDEGVYASNFWFGGPYPAQHLYAPPLLPAAIEWTMILVSIVGVKPTGFIPMIPSLIAGIAMIPSVWWVGRRWFGSSAGIVSAWIVATSDFHASYSRAALTDVPVCLFMLWAVYFIWRSFVTVAMGNEPSSPRKKNGSGSISPPLPWRDIALAGGFTGLAWWTKYNGWLPLAIGMAGGILWQLLTPRADRRILRCLTCWLLIATIAAIVWSPVLWGLQSHGGYAEVAANHRGYVVGPQGWGDSAVKQARHIGLYENWVGMFTEWFGVSDQPAPEVDSIQDFFMELIPVFFRKLRGDGLPRATQALSVVLTRFASYTIPIAMLVIVAIALRLRLRRVTSIDEKISACLLAAWFCGMTVATPFYHPYPRLVLPWLTAVWLGIGLMVQLWRNRTAASFEKSQNSIEKAWIPGRVDWLVVVWMTTNCVIRSGHGTTSALQDRTAFQVASSNIAKAIKNNDGSRSSESKEIVFVYGEPAIVFGLFANGIWEVQPIADLNVVFNPQPWPKYLVVGRQSLDQPASFGPRSKLESCAFEWQDKIHPSHLVELDSPRLRFDYQNSWMQPRISLHRVRE